MAKKKETKPNNVLARTPIIAVMGHVDHGKTSLLDAIRGTDVAASEFGGITQNTRAHQIEHNSQKMTFLDTPGHEAFSQMRSRGAKVTDIVLLVVSADDGVQPQTKESIKFALEAKVPIVVAINKIDLPDVNLMKIKQELSQNNVLVEEYGGDVMVVEVSAKQKKNIDGLIETLLLQAEILELKKNKVAQGTAEAFVIESTLDKRKGPLSLILVKGGEFKVGDHIIHKKGYSKIKAILNERFESVDVANEGDPVWIIGTEGVLSTGELLLFEIDSKKAESIFKDFEQVETSQINNIKGDAEGDNMDLLFALLQDQKTTSEKKLLNLIVKTDTQGTLEAVLSKIDDIGDDQVGVKVIESGTGSITEKDILTAKNTKGIVVGFQVDLPQDAAVIARREKVFVREYKIIYELLDEVSAVVKSMIDPEEEVVEIARATVKKVFELTNGKKVAGCRVTKGLVIKGYKCFVLRGEDEIGDGKITSLKQNKAEVKEVKKEMECGIMIEPEVEFEEGDEIVCYKIEKV